MSIFQRAIVISLAPSNSVGQLPFNVNGYGTLLTWLLWDPRAFIAYVQQFIPRSERSDSGREWTLTDEVMQNAQFIHLTHFVAFTFFCLLAIGIGATIITSGTTTRSMLITYFLASLLFGSFMTLTFILIGVYTHHLPVFELLAFYFGVGLSALFVQEFWVRNEIGRDDIWLLAGFGLSSGFFVGAQINNLYNILDEFLEGEYNQYVLRYVEFLLFAFYLFVILLYVAYNSRFVGMGWAILCLTLSALAAIGGVLRIDNYLWAWSQLPRARTYYQAEFTASDLTKLESTIPRVTCLSPPPLVEWLDHWLETDEINGIRNAEELWQYTNLRAEVVKAINRHLAVQTDGNTLIERVERLMEAKERWSLRDLLLPSRQQVYQFDLLNMIKRSGSPTPKPARKESTKTRRQQRYEYRIGQLSEELDTQQPNEPWRAAIRGFLHLQQKYASHAVTAFKLVRNSTHAREMEHLSLMLTKMLQDENLVFARPPITSRKPNISRHAESWDSLDRLARIQHLAWLYRRSRVQSRRMLLSDEIWQEIGKLRATRIPYLEAPVFEQLLKDWPIGLRNWFVDNNWTPIVKVDNPFIYTEPIYDGQPFCGRQKELRQLREANRYKNTVPVLLYGLPKVGKTSLLHKFANDDRSTTLISVNAGNITIGPVIDQELAKAVCQSFAEATGKTFLRTVEIARELGNNPLMFLYRYIVEQCAQSPEMMFLLILDDFTELQIAQSPNSRMSLSSSERLNTFMRTLQQLVRTVRNFNVVFVASNYSDTFLQDIPWRRYEILQNVQRIPLGALDISETTKLLTPPASAFLLRFSPTVITQIHQFAAGNPFIIQLTASHLVQQFNLTVESQGSAEPVFTTEDFEAVRNNDAFMRVLSQYAEHVERLMD